jgi:signal transduction histidine kinase
VQKTRRVVQICEELARTVGAASDSCVIAWEGEEAPQIVFATGATPAVLHAKAGALVGVPAGALFAGGERAARDLTELCANLPVAEQRLMLRGGKPFAAQLLLRGVSGGAVALVRDLAASQAQADAALRAEDLARFASLVSHEVRNPLSAVKIALQSLERHGALVQNDLRRTEIALREVVNIELLLSEVLEFARPPSLSLVPGDPRGSIEQAVADVEAEWVARGVTFARRLPDRMAPMEFDPVRVRTAVKILCRQAAAAAVEAGGGVVEVSAREEAKGWELTVSDRGHTVPAERRGNAFAPFTPQRARGSGLGLAVVARIAREHGGDARFEPRSGGGNLVIVTFAS